MKRQGIGGMVRLAVTLPALLIFSAVGALGQPTLTTIEYKQAGDEGLLLDVCAPEHPVGSPCPVVIVVHGGGWGSGDRKTMMTAVLETLTQGGYLYVSMDYRLSPQSRWPACREDVHDAVAWTKAHVAEYGGDPDRMAILGYSAGGQLAFWEAIDNAPPHPLKGLVGVAPATDFLFDLGRRGGPSKALRDLINCAEDEAFEKTLLRLYEASPINYLHEAMPPILLLQGTEDRTVPLQQSVHIEKKIKDNHWKVPCDLYRVDGAPHRQSEWDEHDASYRAKLIDWLDVLMAVERPAEPAAPDSFDAVVAADGSGDYTSVHRAIMKAPYRHEGPPWTIRVKPGIYEERIYVQRERGYIKLVGEDPETTVITAGLYAAMKGADGAEIGTYGSPTMQIDGDGFEIENITIENSAGPVGQALALRTDGDKLVFRNCRFLGWQDTLFLNRGRLYFENCTIEGHCDYIFGGATAWFEKCRIHSRKDGYITAASTPPEQPYGFVFNRCTLTGAEDGVYFLGRPWRPYAMTAFLNCSIDEHIRAGGWYNWGRESNEATARYMEYRSSGPGAEVSRVSWAKKLKKSEAKKLTAKKVLGNEWFLSGQATGEQAQ